MKHTGKLARAELYDDHAYPYTTATAVYAANKDRYPDLRLVVTNAHWYDSGAKPCGNYKLGGEVISQQWGESLGFYWSGNNTPIMGWSDMSKCENFIGTVPAIMGGVRQDVSAAKYGAGVVRSCLRTWWGFDADGKCTVEVTTRNYSMAQIVDRMAGLGIVDGLVLDSSGSSQCCDGTSVQKGDGRTIYSYLLLWFEPEEAKKEDKRMKICIDPGHGGTDSANGAPDGSYKEHEFTLDMAQRLKTLLAPCMDVLLTREADESVSLAQRSFIANSAKADVYISIHSNAAKSNGAWNSASGLCIFTYATGASAERNKLAQMLLARYEQTGVKLFGTPLQYAKFAVLSATNMPAALIEFAFHDNRSDTERLLDTDWRQAAAVATAKGICDYCGIEYIEATEEQKTTFYRVQVGAFNSKENAEQLKVELSSKGYVPFVVEAEK